MAHHHPPPHPDVIGSAAIALSAHDVEAADALWSETWEPLDGRSWRCGEHTVDDESEGDAWVLRVICPDGVHYIVDRTGVTTRQGD